MSEIRSYDVPCWPADPPGDWLTFHLAHPGPGKAAIIYHGEGSDRNWLAYALDDTMDEWTRPEAVIPTADDGQEPEMRRWDPDCWLNGDTYYALSGGKNANLMKSSGLKNWKLRTIYDE